MAPLTLVANLATRWCHLHCLQIWPPDGTTCISCQFGHQMALVQNLVISWCHLHCFQSWPPDCVTCIATLPWIALLALSVSIELVSSSARVTSVKSAKGVGITHSLTSRPIDQTPGFKPGYDKDETKITIKLTIKCWSAPVSRGLCLGHLGCLKHSHWTLDNPILCQDIGL